MILSQTEKKYYRIVHFKDGTIGSITLDGLLYMFDKKDIVDKLNEKYTTEKRKDFGKTVSVWYFTGTKDRECAEERLGDKITVNPSTVVELLGYPTIWEQTETERLANLDLPPFTDDELVQDSRIIACKLYQSRFPNISLGDALFAYNKAKSSK